jgi:hypothetical protein
MNWKISLDKYLTTPPHDGFDGWSEDACNKIADTFYDENEKWINEYDGQCNKWLNELFRRGKSPTDAAKIIERAFKFNKINIP